MKKLHLQSLLMITAIIGVTGFQLFWLNQTYRREEKSLAIKTDLAFRDAIQELQVVKLKLDSLPGDTSRPTKVRMFFRDSIDESVTVKMNGGKAIISTINVIRKKAGDGSIKDSVLKNGIFISKDQTYFNRKLELPGTGANDKNIPDRDHLFRLLYGMDSIQDTLKIAEINTALTRHLKQQNAMVPFTISRLNSAYEPDETNINEVTVGFAHPITYQLKLGKTFPYLMKQISLPIVFSILLLGITILSFVLLYRNLLKQRRLTEIKNEFIGNITHELKTPIATVSVAIEAMKNFNALQNPGRTQEYLDISANELQRLSLLVDKVLSLSKFQKNEIEIKKEKFDLLQLTRDVMESMKPQFEKENAVTTLQTSGADFDIEADERHISSVIYNLLDNALKYSKVDPKIDIQLIDHEQYLELRVSDNGIGIAPEYNRKIFEQFFRVPHGDKHNTKGYGLGLSYVNYIVKSHQGFIEVESEMGKGSTFIVKLPFAEAPVIHYDKNRRVIKKDLKL
ncbi:MAG: HAMP domain-containing sensor histidine kinase [Ferruginibacter sp.]